MIIYEDKPSYPIYAPPTGALSANQQLNPDSLAIDTAADFFLEAWFISEYTGPFSVQIQDANGRNLQSAPMISTALLASSSNPTVFSKPVRYPAGGKIQINIADLSGSSNPLQITFVGFQRFAIQK